MRLQILALSLAGLLASAGAAAAQDSNGYPNQVTIPGDSGNNHQSYPGPRIPERRYRYLMRLETLRERVIRWKAQDGGQLSAEHAANLQRQLDKLNRIYGTG